MFEKTRQWIDGHHCDYSDCVSKSEVEDELRSAEANFKELTCIANKWLATEEDAYLGRCVKAAFNMPRFAMIFGESENEIFDFAVVEELIEWGREQVVDS